MQRHHARMGRNPIFRVCTRCRHCDSAFDESLTPGWRHDIQIQSKFNRKNNGSAHLARVIILLALSCANGHLFEAPWRKCRSRKQRRTCWNTEDVRPRYALFFREITTESGYHLRQRCINKWAKTIEVHFVKCPDFCPSKREIVGDGLFTTRLD